MNKERIYRKCVRTLEDMHGDLPLNRACLHMTKIVMDVLSRETNLRAIVQAGSMSWEIVPPHLDDGVCNTHYSYVWSPAALQPYGGAILLPEMHVWVAIPAAQEILDFCVGAFPEAVKRIHGLEWKSPPPPDFLWCHASEIPRGCIYQPNREATMLAMKIVSTL